KARMAENDLQGTCSEEEVDDPNQVGKVIRTTPPSGQQIDKNSQVTIVIGKAKENQKVPVPDINNRTLQEAQQLIQQAGLVVGNVGPAQDPNSRVIAANPGQGAPVDKGSKVDLITVDQGGNGGNGGGGFFGCPPAPAHA